MIPYREVTIDLNPQLLPPEPLLTASQYDNGRPVRVKVQYNGEDFDLTGMTAQISVRKPSGKVVIANAAEVTGSNVIFNLITQMTAEYGMIPTEISLTGQNQDPIGTANWITYVEKSPSSGSPSDTWVQDLDEKVEQATEAAEAAEVSEINAEAWAVGERGGVPVTELDPTYHNNSKYWAEYAEEAVQDVTDLVERAETAAGAAADSATESAGYASDSAASATESAGSATASAGYATQSSQYATNSANSATASASSASASAQSAGQSAASATESAGYATSSENYAGISAGAAEAAGQSATAAAGSASTAAGHATNAANSATASAGSAAQSANSATASATSAGQAAGSATAAAGSADAADASADRAQEILDSIPEDYSELSDDVADLKSAITELSTEKYVVLDSTNPILSVPAISDTITGYTLTQNVKRITLSGTDFAGISSDTNLDWIYTGIITDAKAGTGGTIGQTVLYDKNGVEIPEGTNQNLSSNIGKHCLQPTKRIWIGVQKGAYSTIAEARTALGEMTLDYQLETATTKELYYIPTPILKSVPAISDAYNASSTILTQNVANVALSGTDFVGISSATNIDWIYTKVISGAKVGTGGVTGQTVLYDKNGVEIPEGTNQDLSSNIGKHCMLSTGRIWIGVEKGTYATIAEARTALGTMTLDYQLETAVEKSYVAGHRVVLSGKNNYVLTTEGNYGDTIEVVDVPEIPSVIQSATFKINYDHATELLFRDVKWQNNLTPTFTEGSEYLVILITYDNGENWLASVSGAW